MRNTRKVYRILMPLVLPSPIPNVPVKYVGQDNKN